MSQPIKVPKEIMELVYEKQACEALAEQSGFFRALAYKQKALKANALIFRTMSKVFPQMTHGDWAIDAATGMATKKVDPVVVEKKPRKPRAPKPANPTNALGD